MRNPAFHALLADIGALHERKNHDYATDGDPYSNFTEAAQTAAGFTGIDAVYATLIGIKLARLRQLTASGKTPNNESIADTRRDMATYMLIWAAHAERDAVPNQPLAESQSAALPHGNTPEDEYRQDRRLAHDERFAHATPCEAGCDRVCYPAGVCQRCQRESVAPARGTSGHS